LATISIHPKPLAVGRVAPKAPCLRVAWDWPSDPKSASIRRGKRKKRIIAYSDMRPYLTWPRQTACLLYLCLVCVRLLCLLAHGGRMKLKLPSCFVRLLIPAQYAPLPV
jgi:hypothetical protein